MNEKLVTTAKDLAYIAWCHNLPKMPESDQITEYEYHKRESFENWWLNKVWRQEHRDSLYPEHSVFIDGKKYIELD